MEIETTQVSRSKPKSWKKALLLVLLICLGSVSLAYGGLYLYTRDNGLILEGVHAGTVNLSNLSPTAARQKLESTVTPLLDQSLEFQIQTQPKETLKLSLKDLGLQYDLAPVVQEAYQQGHQGNIFEKAWIQHQAKNGRNVALPLKPQWNKEQLQKTLTTAFSPYNKPMVDATFHMTPDNHMIIQIETFGQEVDLKAVMQTLENLDPLHPQPVVVPIRILDQPQVTAAQLEGMKITGLLGKYTTYLDPSNVERTENVRLAAKALDGVILTPGSEFSFNQQVGERTSSAGYKEAMIIVNDEFVPGLGGGVCQVSSTLYNAVVQSKLEVTERHPHSLEITYVPSGQDATVAYPYLDFKFKNNTSGMVLIRSSLQGKTLSFELYGKV